MNDVFIIDPDKNVLSRLNKELSSKDMNIHTYSDPRVALDEYIDIEPSVVVTEIELGVIDGIDLMARMRSLETDSMYIVYTNVQDPGVFREILKVGANDYILKDGHGSTRRLKKAIKEGLYHARVSIMLEKARREKQDFDQFLRVLVNALPTGLLVLDKDNHVVIWNKCASNITSIDGIDIHGKHRDDLPEIIKNLLDPAKEEIVLEKEDGSHFIEKSIHKIDLAPEMSGIIVVFSDTTELVTARQELESYLMEITETKDLMEEQAGKLALALAEVDKKNEIIEKQNEIMLDELVMAGKLQKSLLPDKYEKIGGLDIASIYIPSIHLGGDLYDILEMDKDTTAVVIADVSGHGVAAALVAAMFKMSLHMKTKSVASPRLLFRLLNREMNSVLHEDYVSSFCFIYDRAVSGITFTNAGHPTPLFYRKADSSIIELDTDGFFIGMFDDGKYEEKTFPVQRGDKIFLYTDCLLEATDKNGRQFGKKRLKNLFLKTLERTDGQQVLETIKQNISDFTGKDHFDDDFTALLIEF